MEEFEYDSRYSNDLGLAIVVGLNFANDEERKTTICEMRKVAIMYNGKCVILKTGMGDMVAVVGSRVKLSDGDKTDEMLMDMVTDGRITSSSYVRRLKGNVERNCGDGDCE